MNTESVVIFIICNLIYNILNANCGVFSPFSLLEISRFECALDEIHGKEKCILVKAVVLIIYSI